jgi:hypothetical protein
MRRFLVALLVLVVSGWAANLKLYLKDGSYHLVREYHVESDRVRFYSVERSQWEEVPLSLVDLQKTQTEEAERQTELQQETKALSEEDAVQQQIQQEVLQIPQDPGVYWLESKQAKILKKAEPIVHTNKGRSVLKILAPVGTVSGKGTLELDTPHSLNIFTNPEQEFYIQLSEAERFGIAKLKTKLGLRIVENLTFEPVTKEVVEAPDMVDTFQKQLTADGLYKIWPKAAMDSGEYAVIEYTEGKLNMQVWDFAIKAAK